MRTAFAAMALALGLAAIADAQPASRRPVLRRQPRKEQRTPDLPRQRCRESSAQLARPGERPTCSRPARVASPNTGSLRRSTGSARAAGRGPIRSLQSVQTRPPRSAAHRRNGISRGCHFHNMGTFPRTSRGFPPRLRLRPLRNLLVTRSGRNGPRAEHRAPDSP